VDSSSDAAAILTLARSRPPTLGGGRLVCIDGPSGSGKTSLATALARLSPEVRVVHTEAMYDGWDGLPRIGEQLTTLLRGLAAGGPGRYRRYDWHAGRYAGEVVVAPKPVLVVEGVGSWVPALADLVTVLVWVEAPPAVRAARALERDGVGFADRLAQWARDETEHFVGTGAREQADVALSA